MTYATVEDVVARFGRTLTAGESAQVGEWLEDLSSDVRLRIPEVEVHAQGDPDYGRLVKRVIAETIIAKLRNPEGLRQYTESVDDYSRTKTVDKANSSGRLFISDEDWSLLLPATAGDAFTIRSVATPGFATHPGVFW
ncbi:Gp19/Gp15/Gp42 family protein [Arthrobacter luteolus]|uniref:Gp19/Gp15/Gp42 family protein n=1 Tax=Arthrobacter luteolus TaxID=98672 RepID=UPI000831AE70|nr:Gp19/Gp15/Gp42 family protein [Arthrobacter luteolus]